MNHQISFENNTMNATRDVAPVRKPLHEIEYDSTATTSEESASIGVLTDDEDLLNDPEEIASHVEEGRRVIQAEADALSALKDIVNEEFGKVVTMFRQTIGRVVITGVGKSGIIGQKIAATFSSTGTPSMFVHAGDAAHGDLGMISSEDVVLAISKSGESAELNAVIRYCGHTGIPLVALTQKPYSSLGRAAKYRLLLPDVPEACGMKVAPTTSSTATLALGDALAVALSQARGFTLKEFGLFHPGGNLGRLSMRIDSVMSKSLPVCPEGSTTVAQALVTMATKRQGCVGVVNEEQRLVGVITEANLHQNLSDMSILASQIMTLVQQTADPRESAYDVLQSMLKNELKVMFVVHPISKTPIGVVHVQDLLGCK